MPPVGVQLCYVHSGTLDPSSQLMAEPSVPPSLSLSLQPSLVQPQVHHTVMALSSFRWLHFFFCSPSFTRSDSALKRLILLLLYVCSNCSPPSLRVSNTSDAIFRNECGRSAATSLSVHRVTFRYSALSENISDTLFTKSDRRV